MRVRPPLHHRRSSSTKEHITNISGCKGSKISGQLAFERGAGRRFWIPKGPHRPWAPLRGWSHEQAVCARKRSKALKERQKATVPEPTANASVRPLLFFELRRRLSDAPAESAWRRRPRPPDTAKPNILIVDAHAWRRLSELRNVQLEAYQKSGEQAQSE